MKMRLKLRIFLTLSVLFILSIEYLPSSETIRVLFT